MQRLVADHSTAMHARGIRLLCHKEEVVTHHAAPPPGGLFGRGGGPATQSTKIHHYMTLTALDDAGSQKTQDTLSSKWVEEFSEEYETVYWTNAQTGESSWNRPSPEAAPAAGLPDG